jgi:hypothetical protein
MHLKDQTDFAHSLVVVANGDGIHGHAQRSEGLNGHQPNGVVLLFPCGLIPAARGTGVPPMIEARRSPALLANSRAGRTSVAR